MADISVVWEESTGPRMQAHARAHIDQMLRRVPGPVAVFDVDETLLFNHPDQEDTIGLNRNVRPVYTYLKRMRVPMYVVTARARTQGSYDYLRRQLEALGYTGFQGMYLTPREYVDDDSPARYKYDARAELQKHHTIILNVGDQITDHLGAEQQLAQPVRRDMYYGLHDTAHPAQLSIKLPEFD